MKQFAAVLLWASTCALLAGTPFAADKSFTLGDFTFVGPADFPEAQRYEMRLAFQYAIHGCVEYEWGMNNIGPVEFSHAQGPPPGLKTPVTVGLRPLNTIRFKRGRALQKGDMVRHYRFVIRFNANPTWDPGSPYKGEIKGVTEKHRGIVYVTFDAAGAVNAVFDYTSRSECPECPAIENDQDHLEFNLAMAICS